MGFAVIARDGTDSGAAARRAAIRPRHLPVIERWAASGALAFAGPIVAEDGSFAGSILLLQVASEAEARRYLAEEPFAQGEVWLDIALRPFTIWPLPYRPLAGAPGGPAGSQVGFAVFAGAPAKARPAAPLAIAARAGQLLVGGDFLAGVAGPANGQLAILDLPDAAAVADWIAAPARGFGPAADQEVVRSGVAALPYAPLPGSVAPALLA
jgi:uncharacterized protein YciI